MKKSYDKILFVTVLLLCWIGIISVFSASTEIANSYYGNELHFLFRQSFWFIIGCFVMFLFIKLPIPVIQSYTKMMLLGCFILLILVLLIGIEVKGAIRWIDIGFMNLQPSTISQFVLILFVADYLYRRNDELEDFKRLVPLLSITFIICLLIAVEPDFSTAAMLSVTVFLLLLVSKTSLKNMVILSFAGVGAAILMFIVESYRIKRLLAFLFQTDAELLTTNWQAYQSILSFGIGGPFGVGFGYSRQKFSFLPEAHTDYILAIIGEESGFIGVFIVLALFLIFIWRGFRIANRVTSIYHYYLSVGLTLYIGLYAFINILVVIGSLPSTGLPLPFISYGGSQLLVNMACVGILLNISSKAEEDVIRSVDEFE